MDGPATRLGVSLRVLTHLVARYRRFVARHWLIAWLPVAALTAGVGFGVHRHVVALDRARTLWQDRSTVVIARHRIAAGSPISSGDVMLVELPSAGAPAAALGALPQGSIARDDLAAGEVVLTNHLLASGGGRLPPGMRGVSMARSPGSLRVAIGDTVQILAVGDGRRPVASPDDGASMSATQIVAERALVVEVSDSSVTIAVEASTAARVAAATAANQAVLVLRSD
jgi:Flp pilus assembly protein CpaB